jgi:hypothetical protein
LETYEAKERKKQMKEEKQTFQDQDEISLTKDLHILSKHLLNEEHHQ